MGASVSFQTFVRAFPTEKTCCDYMFYHVKATWSSHEGCATRCRWRNSRVPQEYMCQACGARDHVKRHTSYEKSRLPVRTIFYAMLLLCDIPDGVSRRFLCRHLGISVKDAFSLIQALQSHMALLELPRTLGGPGKQVLIDESVVRLQHKSHAIVVGMFDGERLLLKIVPDVRGETLISAIESSVASGSVLVTDGWGGYNGLSQRGWDHIVIRHGSGSLSDAQGNSTAPIEAIWRLLKEQLAGAKGHLSLSALELRLSAFVYTFHSRRSDNNGFWRMVSTYPAMSSN